MEKKGINNNKTIEDSFYTDLKLKVASWDNEKEKIKKMLWWDDVVKGLAEQNQQNKSEQSKTNTESDASNDNTSTSTKVTQPATLSPDGQVWCINPMMLINYFEIKINPWHEPLKNPQRTLYNSEKVEKPSNGAFGLVRTNANGNKKR